MPLHQAGSRQIGNRGHFPGVVHLNLGGQAQSAPACRLPETFRPRSGAGFGNGIIQNLAFHAAAFSRKSGFAGRHQDNGRIQELRGPDRPLLLPCPVPRNHVRLRTGAVDSFLDRIADLRDDFCGMPFSANRTAGLEFGPAVCQIFRHGDDKHAAQFRHVPEQIRHSVAQRIPDCGHAGAEGNTVHVRRGNSAAPLRMPLKKTLRHAARFVHIEEQADAVLFQTACQRAQIFLPDLPVPGAFLVRSHPRRQLIQHTLKPERVDAGSGIIRQHFIREKRILRMKQEIAVNSGIGIDHPQGERRRVRGFPPDSPSEFPLEIKRLFRRRLHSREVAENQFPDLPGFLRLVFRQGAVENFFALRFQMPELRPEEIILLQGEHHLFRRPAQQPEQLGIGKQIPVSPDECHITGREPFSELGPVFRRKSQSGGRRRNLFPRSSDDLADPFRRNQVPVAPDHSLPARREMLKMQRGRAASCGQILRFHSHFPPPPLCFPVTSDVSRPCGFPFPPRFSPAPCREFRQTNGAR